MSLRKTPNSTDGWHSVATSLLTKSCGCIKRSSQKPDGKDLYPSVTDEAATLAFTIVMNHPFLDGNKRTAHAAMEVFLVMNGFEIRASVDEQERIMLALAAGELGRDEFSSWLRSRIVDLSEAR